jgi:hypothetical protein
MTSQKLVILLTTLTGGAIGLFAPVGVVRWLMQTEPEDAGILTLFFFPLRDRGRGPIDRAQAGAGRHRRQAGRATIKRSNPEHPDRDDGAQHRQAADGPAGGVKGLIVAGAEHLVGGFR